MSSVTQNFESNLKESAMQVSRRRASEYVAEKRTPTRCEVVARGDALHHFVHEGRVCVYVNGTVRKPRRVPAGTIIELQNNSGSVIATAERNGFHINSRPVLPYKEANQLYPGVWIVVQIPG